ERSVLAEELQLSGLVSRCKLLQDQPSEQAREHAHGQEEVWLAGDPPRPVKRDSATRHDHGNMWMMGERRTPGVQDGKNAYAGAKMFGIGRDGKHGLGRSLEQDAIDHGLVLVSDVGDLSWQREYDVEVRERQEFLLALFQPLTRCRPLTLRAMPVA